jgi:hypothetical protein
VSAAFEKPDPGAAEGATSLPPRPAYERVNAVPAASSAAMLAAATIAAMSAYLTLGRGRLPLLIDAPRTERFVLVIN